MGIRECRSSSRTLRARRHRQSSNPPYRLETEENQGKYRNRGGVQAGRKRWTRRIGPNGDNSEGFSSLEYFSQQRHSIWCGLVYVVFSSSLRVWRIGDAFSVVVFRLEQIILPRKYVDGYNPLLYVVLEIS